MQGLDYRESEELSWCSSCSNSLWQGGSCVLVHCPSGNATRPIWRVLLSSDGTSSWTPLKPQHSIPCWQSVQWEPSVFRSCQGPSKVCGWICTVWPSWVWESQHASLGTLSLGLWVIAVNKAFIASQQSIKNCGIWIDLLDNFPAVTTTSYFLIFSEHPWDKLCANLPHLQFLVNKCGYSSHTDIKLCTYCLYRHTTCPYPWNSLFGQSTLVFWFLTPPTPLIIPQRLPAFLEYPMPLKNWCLIHARCS